MALTLSDDHTQQLAIYERILEQPYSYHPHDMGLGIERDMYFTTDGFAIKVYAEAARLQGRITFSRAHLEAAQRELGLR